VVSTYDRESEKPGEEIAMADKPFNTIKRNDLTPKCPHCGEELPEIYYRGTGSGFVEGRDVVYFCPHCTKVIGVGQSRMI